MLTLCAQCSRHVRVEASECPFCAARFDLSPSAPANSAIRRVALATVGAVALSGALVACGDEAAPTKGSASNAPSAARASASSSVAKSASTPSSTTPSASADDPARAPVSASASAGPSATLSAQASTQPTTQPSVKVPGIATAYGAPPREPPTPQKPQKKP
ncbi:MAG: hypothetical protein U0271_14630 [Polyangiaceae bacterium]